MKFPYFSDAELREHIEHLKGDVYRGDRALESAYKQLDKWEAEVKRRKENIEKAKKELIRAREALKERES